VTSGWAAANLSDYGTPLLSHQRVSPYLLTHNQHKYDHDYVDVPLRNYSLTPDYVDNFWVWED